MKKKTKETLPRKRPLETDLLVPLVPMFNKEKKTRNLEPDVEREDVLSSHRPGVTCKRIHFFGWFVSLHVTRL